MSKTKTIKDLVKELQDQKQPRKIQEVRPVSKSKNEGMVQCTFYIDKELKKRFKRKAVGNGQSIKLIITAAIEEYLEK
jgi:hypothetical protein